MLLKTDKRLVLYKRAAMDHLFTHGIETEDELQFVMRDCLGVRIPTEVCCDNHQPMWEAVADDFFHRVRKQALQHCRGGGKTFQVGSIKSIKFIAYPGIRISNFAATEQQSKALLTYTTQRLGPMAPPEVKKHVQEVYGAEATGVARPVPGRDGRHQSKMKGLVGTLKGVNSAHVDDLVVDERAQMDDGVFKEAMGMMTASSPYPGILTVLSTVKALGDPMDVLMKNGEELGFKTYISCILDVTNCQESNCNGCKATIAKSDDGKEAKSFYDFCGGRLLGRNLGHFSVATARDKFVGMGLTNARAQLFCEEPDSEERAFPGFSPTTHVAELNVEKRWGTADGDFIILGDFGKSDNSAWVKVYLTPNDIMYIDDELIGNGKTVQEWIPILRERGWLQPDQPYVVDIAGRQTHITDKRSAIDYLSDAGAKVVSRTMGELETTEHVRDLLKASPPQLMINPRCKKVIDAFNRSTNKSQGQGDQKIFLKVIKHNKFSHPIDAIRYGASVLVAGAGIKMPKKWKPSGGR